VTDNRCNALTSGNVELSLVAPAPVRDWEVYDLGRNGWRAELCDGDRLITQVRSHSVWLLLAKMVVAQLVTR
jgi:hypothetical protein